MSLVIMEEDLNCVFELMICFAHLLSCDGKVLDGCGSSSGDESHARGFIMVTWFLRSARRQAWLSYLGESTDPTGKSARRRQKTVPMEFKLMTTV